MSDGILHRCAGGLTRISLPILALAEALHGCGSSRDSSPAAISSLTPNAAISSLTPKVSHRASATVALRPDGGNNQTTATVCGTLTALKREAVAFTDAAHASGCEFRKAGPVVFIRTAGTVHVINQTHGLSEIRAINGSWHGYVEDLSLDGLPPKIYRLTLVTDTTPRPTPTPELFKIFGRVNALNHKKRCGDAWHAMRNSAAFKRVQLAFASGNYNALQAGDKVTLWSGDSESGTFVMVRGVTQGFAGCVPVTLLKGIR